MQTARGKGKSRIRSKRKGSRRRKRLFYRKRDWNILCNRVKFMRISWPPNWGFPMSSIKKKLNRAKSRGLMLTKGLLGSKSRVSLTRTERDWTTLMTTTEKRSRRRILTPRTNSVIKLNSILPSDHPEYSKESSNHINSKVYNGSTTCMTKELTESWLMKWVSVKLFRPSLYLPILLKRRTSGVLS